VLKKINATGNPGCTVFNSECTISAKNTLRIGPGIDKYLDTSLANQTAGKVKPPTIDKRSQRKMADCPSYYQPNPA